MVMRCPFCGCEQTNVKNSRATGNCTQVWRRRVCTVCKEIFSTYENIKLSYLKVEKKDNSIVRYSRAKLYSSIYHCAVGSRRTDRGAMGELAERVTQLFEKDLVIHKVKIIKSSEIINNIPDGKGPEK